MNRATLIDQIEQAKASLEKLLSRLQSAPVERERFASHRYQSRREYRRTCETAGKSGKEIEQCVIASFRVAERMGFKGEFRQWEHLLRVGDENCDPFFSLGRGVRIVQEGGRLPRSLKATSIQRSTSFCSVRIQANSFRIFLSSFSMLLAFINPAWRRNVVEFGGFIAFEGKSCDERYTGVAE